MRRLIAPLYAAWQALSAKYIFRRTQRLRDVQRFIGAWLAVWVLVIAVLTVQINGMDSHYLVDGPKAGGTYVEGVIGTIESINPLFPESSASNTASKLIFNGLARYNPDGEIEPDLASKWSISGNGTTYTVKLRQGVQWHDGQPFTAHDVKFTYEAIQDPDTRSPYNLSWRNVEIKVINDHTVQFKLPNPYTPFVHSLTTGILPKHILGEVAADQLRKVEFNQRPVGTGPFVFREFVQSRGEVQLDANLEYFRGKPRVEFFTIKSFADPDELMSAFRANVVTSAAGLRTFDIELAESDPEAFVHQLLLPAQVFAFFNTTRPVLNDETVRQGLVAGTNIPKIVEALEFRYQPAHSALLPEHIGYKEAYEQITFNASKARSYLTEAGWKQVKGGIRSKGGKAMRLRMVAQNSDVYPTVATVLQQQWRALGVRLDVNLVSPAELQENHIRSREYDILLYGINLGADPDQFSYWHSSQSRDPGLNLSRYSSPTVDLALEAGRTRQNVRLRSQKYQTFQRVWRVDAPAVALYRPYYYYATQKRVKGDRLDKIIDPPDRFYDVHTWTVNVQPVLKRLYPSA